MTPLGRDERILVTGFVLGALLVLGVLVLLWVR